MQSTNLLSKCLPDQYKLKESSRSKHHAEEISLKSIHDILQEETDKMVRWKVSTEVSLNQKERQLNEYQKVIEALRTNIFEEQMKNETLSQNILREKEKKELIEEHAYRTRNLCDALIQRHQELEVIINENSDIRDRLETYIDDVKSQSISLSGKFSNMSIKYESIFTKLQSEAESKIIALNRDIENMKDYISLKEDELKKREDECEINNLVIKEFSQKYFLLGEKLESISANYNWTLAKLQKVEKTSLNDRKLFEDKLVQLESLTENFQIELNTTNEKLCESRLEFEEAAEKVKYLQESESSSEMKIKELLNAIEGVQSSKDKAAKEFEMRSQKLEEIIAFSSENENVLRAEILNLENCLSSCRSELEEKKVQNDDLLKNCETDRANFIAIEENLKQQSESLQKEIRMKTTELENLVKDLKQSQNEYQKITEEKDSLVSKVQHLQENNNELNESLTLSNNKIMVMEEENTKLKEQMKEQHELVQEILENGKDLSASKDKILKENSKLKEDIGKLGLQKKELEKSVNTGKKNLTLELKRNEKLKTRIQNLECKLKENESAAESDRESLKKVIEELEAELQELKNCYNELKISSENLKEENKELKNEVEKTKNDVKVAESLAEENEMKAKLAENEGSCKVREMLELSEIFKKDSESVIEEKSKENLELRKEVDEVKESLLQTQQAQDVLLNMKSKLEETIQKKNAEILALTEKFSEQTKEFNQLRCGIKNLTMGQKGINDSELRTPSPSQYLPLFQTSLVGNTSSPLGKRLRIPLKSHHSILKQNSNQIERQTSKAVTFLSPVFRAPDSDSSDGFAIDIQSDSDDRFDAIRRSSNVRYCRPDIKKTIPKANITPLQRASVTEKDGKENANDSNRSNESAFKRPRYDKVSIKTYTSPKSKKKSKSNFPET